MRFSNDKDGGFLTNCAIMLVVALYIVSFERVTCSPVDQRADQPTNVNSLDPAVKRRTIVITVNVTGLSPEQIQNARNKLREEMICNLKRSRNKPLPAYCIDATKTTASITTAMEESTLESTTPEIDTTTTADQTTTGLSTTSAYRPGRLPDEAKRRKRNALEKDNDVSVQNLQSHRIRFGPDAEPDVKRKRRQASVATETDCEELLLSDDGQDASDGSLVVYLFQRDDCNETDIIGDLEQAAKRTNDTGRFDAKTNATILDFGPYNDPFTTYFTTEETTITTIILTTEEETTTTDILTTEETTATTILTTEETTIIADNSVTTYYSTNPSTGEINVTDPNTALNSTLPPHVLVTYKIWLPFLIAIIVLLLIFVIFRCCQKGKKQRPRRRPRPDTSASQNRATSQPTPSEATNGPRPPSTTNGSPRLLDDSNGYLIPMDQFNF